MPCHAQTSSVAVAANRLAEHVVGAGGAIAEFAALMIRFPELREIDDPDELLDRIEMLRHLRLPDRPMELWTAEELADLEPGG